MQWSVQAGSRNGHVGESSMDEFETESSMGKSRRVGSNQKEAFYSGGWSSGPDHGHGHTSSRPQPRGRYLLYTAERDGQGNLSLIVFTTTQSQAKENNQYRGLAHPKAKAAASVGATTMSSRSLASAKTTR
jgi:hypothetical protein